MNCLVIEQDDRRILIDCGVTFPSEALGIDVIHPRFDYILDAPERLDGVIITHGHEDHIGALPYLLSEIDVPVYGPAHAMELIKRRLDEHGFRPDEITLHTTRVGEPYQVGPFGIEPIRVTHSIADATALAIRTSAGVIVHTGDFKLDPSPSDGELTDEARLAELGREGVRLLLSDSTNVDSPGTARSEHEVGEALDRVIGGATERVIVGMFASNVQRLILLGKIAQRTGRRICLMGRSVENHVRVAERLGMLGWPSDLLMAKDQVGSTPRERVLILAGGTQAESRASLTRLALGTHPALRLDPGDMVILSSRIIPGNDRPVYDMMASFLRAGIELVTRVTEPEIHASGHAHREEQVRMIELTQPRSFMPVHGTLHHLMRHAELARQTGVAHTLVIENGEVAHLPAEGEPFKQGGVTVGRVATFHGDELEEEVLQQRRRLAQSGVAMVSLVLAQDGRPIAPVQLRASGLLPEGDDRLRVVERAIERAVVKAGAFASDEQLADIARTAARRSFANEVGHRPPVIVTVSRL